MRRPPPTWAGFLYGMGSMAVLALCFTYLVSVTVGVDSIPAGVLDGLAQAGIGLLIAYSVAVAGVTKGSSGSRRVHEEWLGFTSGVGASGLIGVAFCLGFSGSWNAEQAGVPALFGFWWAVASISAVGVVVATLPLLNYGWSRADESIPAATKWRARRSASRG